jgi:phage gp36-like protein
VYCERADLTDYVLEAYLVAADEQKPGVVDKTIAQVSEEMNDTLRSLYILPLPTVPPTIKRICAVIAAYRAVGSVTSLMDSSGSSGNDFLTLQTQYKEALKDKELLRQGKLDLGLEELGAEPQEEAGTSAVVVTSPKKFDLSGF